MLVDTRGGGSKCRTDGKGQQRESNGQKSAQERMSKPSIRPKAKERLTEKPFYLRNFFANRFNESKIPGMEEFPRAPGRSGIEVT